MIPLNSLEYKEYKKGIDDSSLNLKEDFIDFINEKKVSRIILLDEGKSAKYVLHKSILEGFISEEYFGTIKRNEASGEATANNQGGAGANLGAEGGGNNQAGVGVNQAAEEAQHGEAGAADGENQNRDGGGNNQVEGVAGANQRAEGAAINQAGSVATNDQTSTTSQIKKLTFADLKQRGNETVQAILKDGIKFIKEDSSLSDAKALMKLYTTCNDVFVTKNGLPTDPVMGWITNVTITENSMV